MKNYKIKRYCSDNGGLLFYVSHRIKLGIIPTPFFRVTKICYPTFELAELGVNDKYLLSLTRN